MSLLIPVENVRLALTAAEVLNTDADALFHGMTPLHRVVKDIEAQADAIRVLSQPENLVELQKAAKKFYESVHIDRDDPLMESMLSDLPKLIHALTWLDMWVKTKGARHDAEAATIKAVFDELRKTVIQPIVDSLNPEGLRQLTVAAINSRESGSTAPHIGRTVAEVLACSPVAAV